MKSSNASISRYYTLVTALIAILSPLFATNASADCVAPPAGLVSWWRGEANALDQAGTNHGTLAGNATYGAGRVGQGFVFDGYADLATVGNPTSLQLQDFTIEVWMKRTSAAS